MTLPTISIVTPSFNQGRFLEATLRSVLDQGYPRLQFGVIDGGSTDGSIDVIERYRHRLDFAVVEPDRGQSEAINKGLRRATGDIVAWLNSDDTLLPGKLERVGRFFADHRDQRWLIGQCRLIDESGDGLDLMKPLGEFTLRGALIRRGGFCVPQPATFWRRSLLDECGLLDESLHHCMDFDLWCRFLAADCTPTILQEPLATYRFHRESKSCAQSDRFIRALIDIEKRYAPLLGWRDRLTLHRLIGYQKRAYVVRTTGSALWKQVVRRPWWLGSQQVRIALRHGPTAARPPQAAGTFDQHRKAA